MLRLIIGVIVGYMVWTVIWLGGNAFIFAGAGEAIANGERFDDVGPLAGALVLSVVCSLAGGAAAAAIGSSKGALAAMITAILLLLTGLGVQASAWDQMPVWYHLSFLVLLVPMTLLGGKLASRKAGATAP